MSMRPADIEGNDMALERRYRRLLRFYPAGYRRERGDELLDVLLQDAASGQRRPGVRDAGALIAGSLRIRFGVDHSLSLAVSVRMAAIGAMVVFLALQAADALDGFASQIQLWMHYGAGQSVSAGDWRYAVVGALTLATAVLLWTNRGRMAVVAAAGAVLAMATWRFYHDPWTTVMAPLINMIMVTIAVAVSYRRARPAFPRSWAWLLVAYLAVRQVWGAGVGQHLPSWSWLPVSYAVTYCVFAVALMLLFIDARLAVAASILSLIGILADVALSPTETFAGLFQQNTMPYSVVYLAVPVVVGVAGALRLRRQVAL